MLLFKEAQFQDSDNGYNEYIEFFDPEKNFRYYMSGDFTGYNETGCGEFIWYDVSHFPWDNFEPCKYHPEKDYILL